MEVILNLLRQSQARLVSESAKLIQFLLQDGPHLIITNQGQGVEEPFGI